MPLPRPRNSSIGFPSEVHPGPDGSITYAWGEDFRGTCRIRVWDPPRHLRTGWAFVHPDDPEQESELAVDWFLQGDQGRTRLRLVHSGFGEGEAWDDEFEGTRRGWAFELRSLKHYLEKHPGKQRRAFWIRRAAPMKPMQVWSRIFASEGLIQMAGDSPPKSGERIDFRLASGDRIQGTVLLCDAPNDFAVSTDNLKGSLIRCGSENCTGRSEAHVIVSLWDIPPQKAARLQERLEEEMERIFPESD